MMPRVSFSVACPMGLVTARQEVTKRTYANEDALALEVDVLERELVR